MEIVNQQKFKKGDKVRIKSTTHTDSTWGVNSLMLKLLGKEVTIESNISDYVQINGYYWNPKDLQLISGLKIAKMINSKSGKFDPALLDI